MKNFRIALLLLIGVFMANYAISQSLKPSQEKKFVKKGRKAHRKFKYWEAKGHYDRVTESNSSNAEYWFEAGLVYYNSKVNREASLPKFEKALELSVNDTTPELLLYLGNAYHFTNEFEKAIVFYNIFKSKTKDNQKGLLLAGEVDKKIEICNNAIAFESQEPQRQATVLNMGKKVNSDAADYAVVITNNENLILFCSRRPPGSKKNIDGQYFEDIFYTSKVNGDWSQATVIDKNSGYVKDEINNGKSHEAPVAVSPDGNSLFIYKENGLWKSEKDDNGQWSIPKKMNQNINIGTFNPSVFITPNNNEMFIVSLGAQGGLGGRDIYHATRQEDGTWGEPVNLGPTINTDGDEDAPFMSQDGKTLYFSSNGHNTMGGFDIYKTEKDENGNWSEPLNIGSPINSAGDDIYYVENKEGTIAYYASQRPGSMGYLDLYTATFGCKNIPTTNILGYAIYANNHQPIDGVVKITDTESGEEMGTYNVNPKTGKYNLVLPPNKNYTLELMVNQSKYNQVRPHKENFFIPEQCEAYNLFQQISINYLKDSTGNTYAQKAHFRNAMFDIQSEIEKEMNSSSDVNSTFADSSSFIQGELAYNSIIKATNVTVTLLNANHEIMRITTTDDNGAFAFEQLNIDSKYIILINEDDAKRNYFGDNTNNNSAQINIDGKVYGTKNGENTSLQNTTVYLANSEKVVSNTTSTNSDGIFKVNNQPEDKASIASLNEQMVITYNMNVPTQEVLFSAYILTIDPNNTELAYTEHIDIIELRDVDVQEMPEFANIYFDFDKFFLRQKSKNILDNLYDYLAANPNATLRLDGHTDWIGTETYNDKLSEERTLKAYKYLIEKGISPDRIVNQWFGETKQAVPNENADGTDNPDNRQLNRRVEIKVQVPEMAALYIQL